MTKSRIQAQDPSDTKLIKSVRSLEEVAQALFVAKKTLKLDQEGGGETLDAGVRVFGELGDELHGLGEQGEVAFAETIVQGADHV